MRIFVLVRIHLPILADFFFIVNVIRSEIKRLCGGRCLPTEIIIPRVGRDLAVCSESPEEGKNGFRGKSYPLSLPVPDAKLQGMARDN